MAAARAWATALFFTGIICSFGAIVVYTIGDVYAHHFPRRRR